MSARPALAKIGVETPEAAAEAAQAAKPRKPSGLPMPPPLAKAGQPINTKEKAEQVKSEKTTQERVGVYVCHCGSNIAGVVDVADVSSWAGKELAQNGVVVSRDYKFMCSSLGQELIEKDIKELGLTRVVVASCSPHLHEPTFRNACARAGLNPYLFEMSNIREQELMGHNG